LGSYSIRHLTYLIIITSRAFALSEIKILMQYKYLSPIKLLIIYGIIGVIITIITGAISSLVECSISSELEICKIKDIKTGKIYLENFRIWIDYTKINFGKICLFLIGLTTYFLNRLFYFFIIRNLTIMHIIFSNIIYSYFLLLIGFIIIKINKKDINNNYLGIFIDIIIQIVVIFGFLIYLEIIELDFCNLNYNLKKI